MLMVAQGLRRIMAEQGLTAADVEARTGVDERTVKNLLAGERRPHARTLHRVAQGLNVEMSALFSDGGMSAALEFDRRSNPAVDQVLNENPGLFAGWSAAEFAELYSRFGVGGALTPEGVQASVEAMNAKRELHEKIDLLLETGEADLLRNLVELLYQRVLVPS